MACAKAKGVSEFTGIKELRQKESDRLKIAAKFLKDHRVFMMSCVAALTLGGSFKIYDKSSINSSFPNFLVLLKKLGAKIK